MRGIRKGVEDWVEEKLSEVIDGVRNEGSDAQIVGSGLTLGSCESSDVYACEEEEGVLVV